MTYGVHRFEFDVIQGWEKLPEGWHFVEVAGVRPSTRRTMCTCSIAAPIRSSCSTRKVGS